MNKEFEGVVILGSPRSGTTLLRRLVNSHPGIVCPPETNLLGAASRFLEEHEFAGGLSVGVVPGLGFSGFDDQQVIERLRNFIFSFWQEIADKNSAELWAEKTAVDVFHIDAIERLCGDKCRYICITRHALDVVCSLKDLSVKMDAFLPEIHEYVRAHESMSEAFAAAWCAANERLQSLVNENPDLCLQLKYEDLVSDPLPEMNRIFAFLDMDTVGEEQLHEALRDKQSPGLGDWKTYEQTSVSKEHVGRHASLDGWTLQKLAPMVNPLLQSMGYGTVKSPGATAHQDPTRAQALSRMVAAMKMSDSGEQD